MVWIGVLTKRLFSFLLVFFFFKQKTAYEIYQCDWSSDVCSSDLDFSKNDDDAAEVAGDLAAIAMLHPTPGEPDEEEEEQERDLVELEEYVRVGVQLIYLQLRDKKHDDETEADRV